MTTYILKRIAMMIPTLIGITIVAFLIIHIAPREQAAMKAQTAGGILVTQTPTI